MDAPVPKLAEVLRHPDDLDKLSSLKQEFSRKKAAVDSQLRSGLREQLETTQSGMTGLTDGQKTVQQIKEEMIKIDRLCKRLGVTKGSFYWHFTDLGAYLDAGMARWPMPHRERGLLACFVESMECARGAQPAFVQRAVARLVHAHERGTGPRAFALSLLAELGVAKGDFDAYVSRTLLELPGWTGMLARLEQFPGERPEGCPPLSLRARLYSAMLISWSPSVVPTRPTTPGMSLLMM